MDISRNAAKYNGINQREYFQILPIKSDISMYPGNQLILS
jgi:hypothetical protein